MHDGSNLVRNRRAKPNGKEQVAFIVQRPIPSGLSRCECLGKREPAVAYDYKHVFSFLERLLDRDWFANALKSMCTFAAMLTFACGFKCTFACTASATFIAKLWFPSFQ